MFSQIKRLIDNILIYILMILVVTMLLCVCWQVFSRYILHMPATFTEELVRFLLIWIGFLGAAYSFSISRHLSISFIKNKLSSNIQKILSYIIMIIITFVAIGLLIFGGIQLILITWNQSSKILNIPMGFIYTILPLTGLIILFYNSYNMYKLLTGKNQ